MSTPRSKDITNGILQALGIIVISLAFIYLLWLVREIIAYIFIAFALSFMGRPLNTFLAKRFRFNTALSATLTIIVLFALTIGVFWMIIPMLFSQAQNLSLLDFDSLRQTGIDLIDSANQFFKEQHFNMRLDLDSLLPTIEQGDLTSLLNSTVSSITTIGIGIFSILFITFFFLSDKGLMQEMLFTIVPDKEEGKIKEILDETKELLTRYFWGLLLQFLIMFTIYFIVLLVFGIEDALFIALICGACNLIPYLGPLVGFVIIMLLSASSMYSTGLDFSTQIIYNLLYIGIGYIMAQGIDNFINQPLIYSKSVKSHPLEIFIVMLIAGTLFGVLGVVFAVPGYTVLRVVLRKFFYKYKVVKSITKGLDKKSTV